MVKLASEALDWMSYTLLVLVSAASSESSVVLTVSGIASMGPLAAAVGFR
jgi:hypothetical protein